MPAWAVIAFAVLSLSTGVLIGHRLGYRAHYDNQRRRNQARERLVRGSQGAPRSIWDDPNGVALGLYD